MLAVLGLAAILLLQFTRGFLGTAQLPRIDRCCARRCGSARDGARRRAAAAVFSLLSCRSSPCRCCSPGPACRPGAPASTRRACTSRRNYTAAALLHYALVRAGVLEWKAAGSADWCWAWRRGAVAGAGARRSPGPARRAAHRVDTAARDALLGRLRGASSSGLLGSAPPNSSRRAARRLPRPPPIR
ncbi:MAG: hypothetical protein U1F06_02020 [Steroidobacteraceae bacterium]